MKTFLLIYQLHYIYRTDIDESMAISFHGVRTDRHGFGILTWKHVGTQKKINLKLKISG